MTERLAKRVYAFYQLTIFTKRSIWDIWQRFKDASATVAINIIDSNQCVDLVLTWKFIYL